MCLSLGFYNTLPPLAKVPKSEADIAWLIYDLQLTAVNGQQKYKLTKMGEAFTKFAPALLSITTPVPGEVTDFLALLQSKLDEQLETPPTTKTIESPF